MTRAANAAENALDDISVESNAPFPDPLYSDYDAVPLNVPEVRTCALMAPHMALLQMLQQPAVPVLVINCGMHPHAIMAQVCACQLASLLISVC